ncbi:MAG TPA: aminodeoxychorismate lyase [Fluviicoccus sp.]|nr:aminodeoxychorismate lyase [Fluviicoccus sp.]
MLTAVWLNGVAVDGVAADDRGFAYGDGHFTTMAVRNGEPPLMERHWQRLQQASLALGMADDRFAVWRQDFLRFVALYPEITAKIVITRGQSGRGYLPDPDAPSNCYFLAWPLTDHSHAHQAGISSGVLAGQLGLNPLTAGYKHLNRLEQVFLRRELAKTGYPEAVVCDLNGEVVEGVFSNLFVVRGSEVLTPALTSAGVAGVMRAFLMDYLSDLQHTVVTSRLRVEDLSDADELFFCNSVYGIWPVRCFNGRKMPPNPVTQRLQQHLKNVRITT